MKLNEADLDYTLIDLYGAAQAGERAAKQLAKQVEDLNIMLKASRGTLRETRQYVKKLEKRIAKLEDRV